MTFNFPGLRAEIGKEPSSVEPSFACGKKRGRPGGRRCPPNDKRHRTAICLGIAAALMFSSACRSQQIWLSGVDPVVAADRAASSKQATPEAGANDFMALFHAQAEWRKASASIRIFKVSTQFLQRADDSQLKTVIEDLRRRHIALPWKRKY